MAGNSVETNGFDDCFPSCGEEEGDDNREGSETLTGVAEETENRKYTYHIKINILSIIYKVYI